MSSLDLDICYVLMPFGPKTNPFPGLPSTINFDYVYDNLIDPAIRSAGLQPFRADQEMTSGSISRAMFERLLLCKYAVADLTTANPNVYYELGIRHAVRPWSTVLLYGNNAQLPFDIKDQSSQRYTFDENGSISDLKAAKERLSKLLGSIKQTIVSAPIEDSPLFMLLGQQGYKAPDLREFRSEIRQTIETSSDIRKSLSEIEHGRAGLPRLKEVEDEIFDGPDFGAPLLLEVLTAYRRIEAWDEMLQLIEKMPDSLKNAVTVQEQYAMALGRRKDFDRAEMVLKNLIDKRGPSSLTYSFLGVVQKARFLTVRGIDEVKAWGALAEALDAFMAGFKLDPRVIFVGINLVLLLEARGASDKNQQDVFPVVRYFINEAVASPRAGFWEHAAELELAVLEDDDKRAFDALGRMMVDYHEPWMPFSTFTNLQIIKNAREKRGTAKPWYADLVGALERELKNQPESVSVGADGASA